MQSSDSRNTATRSSPGIAKMSGFETKSFSVRTFSVPFVGPPTAMLRLTGMRIRSNIKAGARKK